MNFKVKNLRLSKTLLCVWLMVLYIVFSLIIGEFHPFSKAEMYNSFPQNAEIITVTDKDGIPLPLNKFFKYSTADLTHNFSAIKQTEAYSILDSNVFENKIGIVLNKQLLPYQYKMISRYDIRLVSLSYKAETLSIKSKKLYEFAK